MNILITGGAGFIGSHILQRFSKENCQITVLNNLHSGNKTNIPDGFNFIEMDICDERIIDVFEKSKPEKTTIKINDVSYLNSLEWQAKTDLLKKKKKTYNWYKSKL